LISKRNSRQPQTERDHRAITALPRPRLRITNTSKVADRFQIGRLISRQVLDLPNTIVVFGFALGVKVLY
jgi:hypothetical protein